MVYESEIIFSEEDGQLIPAYPEVGELFEDR